MKHQLLCLDVKEASSICSDMKLITQYNQQNILLKSLMNFRKKWLVNFQMKQWANQIIKKGSTCLWAHLWFNTTSPNACSHIQDTNCQNVDSKKPHCLYNFNIISLKITGVQFQVSIWERERIRCYLLKNFIKMKNK